MKARAQRPRPHRDEKILTGWNGLAITALCQGYQVLGREDLLEVAVKAATFNGISLANLLVLAEVTGDPAFAYRAQLLEQGLPSEVASIPMVYMATLNAVLLRMAGAASCSVVVPTPGDTPPREVRELWTRFLPFVTVVWRRSGVKGAKMLESREALGDKATLYVCRHAACQEPTVDVERAVRVCSTTSITFGE